MRRSAPWGLKRNYGTGVLHLITWSCLQRRPQLDTGRVRDLFLTVLELMRDRDRFGVVGYVVMPEYVHLLISEPLIGDPSIVVQAVKLGFTQRWRTTSGISGQFWQRRFYDPSAWLRISAAGSDAR